VEDKNEDTLEAVEYYEQVCKQHRIIVQVEQTDHPRQTQQHDKHCGSLHPGPVGNPHKTEQYRDFYVNQTKSIDFIFTIHQHLGNNYK